MKLIRKNNNNNRARILIKINKILIVIEIKLNCIIYIIREIISLIGLINIFGKSNYNY